MLLNISKYLCSTLYIIYKHEIVYGYFFWIILYLSGYMINTVLLR